jgi:type VI secretion system secreted protein VgrG
VATDTQLHYTFVTGDYSEEDLRVLRFSGVEGISTPFEFEIELAVQAEEPEFEERVGEEATFSWITSAGERHVHGIVRRWEEIGRGKKQTRYLATLVPRLWMLSLNRQSRIFQGKSTPDIVKAVLEGAGIPSDQFKLSLQRSYKPRNYCVQYRESDLDFLMRLLEEEGIFYFFEQSEKSHKLVMSDSNDGTEPIADFDELVFREQETGMAGVEHVSRLRVARSLRVGAVSLKEFDFKKPHVDMKSESEGESSKEKKLKAYDYPGEYHETALGKELAKIRLEEERAERLLAVGESDCRGLIPGGRFTLAEHPRDDLNQEYLVLRVRHQGRLPAGEIAEAADEKLYRNAFECIPAATTYRPPRVTPRPTIEGPQTALVVGPSGEEIHCDEHGRVKVRFPWDRLGKNDDTASCWVRVSQNSGGGGWGSMVIPRIGQEVVITFLEGDPDRPLITGRVYNGERPTPYQLPGQHMISALQSSTSPGGGSGNELRFNDTAASMELFFNASKDHDIDVANDKNRKVTANQVENIGAARTRDVDGDENVNVTGNREETVLGSEILLVKGDEKDEIDGSLTVGIGTLRMRLIKGESKLEVESTNGVNVGAAQAYLVKGDFSENADGDRNGSSMIHLAKPKGDYEVESDGEVKVQVAGLILRKSDGDIKLEAKGSYSLIAAMCKIKASNVTIESKGKIVLAGEGGAIVMDSSSIAITGTKITADASGTLTMKGTPQPWN